MIQFLPKKTVKEALAKLFPSKELSLHALSGGLLNQNYCLTIGRKQLVVKVYRPDLSQLELQEMHRVLDFVAKKGVPVAPLILETTAQDFNISVYPFIKGVHPKRYHNDPKTIHNMGKVLGEIHASLDQYKTKLLKKTSAELATWNPEKFLSEIQTLREKVRKEDKAKRTQFNDHLDIYQRIIESDSWSTEPFLKLPIRLIQGDFHTKNILATGSHINAILDWEKFGWSWRGFEIMRSVIFNCRKNKGELDWNLVETYLKAYQPFAKLNHLEKELTFECGYRKMLFSLWAEKEWLSGRKELFANMQRRARALPNLTKHRQEYAERIATLLK